MYDDGSFPLEIQAAKVADMVASGATRYHGDSNCGVCGLVLNPVQALYSKGLCPQCSSHKAASRVKGRLA